MMRMMNSMMMKKMVSFHAFVCCLAETKLRMDEITGVRP